jgi:hypothetical protein
MLALTALAAHHRSQWCNSVLGSDAEIKDDDELRAGRADRGSIVTAKIGNGFEVRRKPPGQPHHFDIALAFPLKTPAGLDAIE